MLCPSCAHENPVSNGYCGSCGTVLNDAAVVIPQYGDRKRFVKREVAVIFGGVAALLAAGWVAWYLLVSSRSPAHVVESFIAADRAGQYSREQQLVSDNSRMALDLFQVVRRQSASSPFQNYRILKTSEDRSGAAYVEVEITMPQPTIPFLTPTAPAPAPGAPPPNVKMRVTFILTHQGDDWKIDSGQTLAAVISALAGQSFQQFQLKMPNFPNIPLPPNWPNMGPSSTTPAPGSTPNAGAPSSMDGSI